MRVIADRLAGFGTTIFSEMSALAQEHKAINLSQGFPDFDGPAVARKAARRAIEQGENQYAPMPGLPALREAIAERWERLTGTPADPASEVTVTSGCTEAINASMLGLLNPGDEVVVFEPYYDCYRAAIAMAGGVARFVTLAPRSEGGFGYDPDQLRRAFTERTRMVLFNTPHNPTGKVFSRAELEEIASLSLAHDAWVVSDEVYEDLTYDACVHERIATLPGMADRTLTLSSLGKGYSLTGWKIGWAIGPAHLTAAVRSAHQFLTFSVATPLQHGAAAALREGGAELSRLRAHYKAQRDRLAATLASVGFEVHACEGSYFLLAEHGRISRAVGLKDDVEVCRWLTREVGVAAIPPSAFYDDAHQGRSMVRFAFCKQSGTIDAAMERLARITDLAGA